jgi:hypothetical protein
MLSINNPKKIITLFMLIFAGLSLYDTLVDIVLWLLHSMFALFHALFEFSEHVLDILIEHLFHTDSRTTEIIVFYLMLSIGGGAAIKLMQALPLWYGKLIEQQINFWCQEKAKALSYWQNQSLIEKIKWGSVFMASTTIMVLWVFN